jgi:hypothetical protein
MATATLTLNQIQQKGLEALSRELGPVGMVRFLQMFEMGEGNYSLERHQWLDDQTVAEIAQRIQQRKSSVGRIAD